MKTLTAKIPEELYSMLTDLAASQGESKSALVRTAIQQLVGREGKKQEKSAISLVRDLVGCVEGPGDLSHNPKHLKGYGK